MMKIESFTTPTKSFGNWERLKSISDKRIITEIILTAHYEISDPSYKIRSGDYYIGEKVVTLEINENIVFRIQGKILEIEFDPNKAPYKEKPKLKIPDLIVSWFNEILRQNNFPEINFIKDIHWTKMFVSYKLKNEVIAQRIYPKSIKLKDGYRFEYGDNKPIEIIKNKKRE